MELVNILNSTILGQELINAQILINVYIVRKITIIFLLVTFVSLNFNQISKEIYAFNKNV